MQDEYFPADLIILNTSHPKGNCYIETKSLDGETNLKNKVSLKETVSLITCDEDVIHNLQNIHIQCENPNEFLYNFEGTISIKGHV